jgi:hypothetical protein
MATRRRARRPWPDGRRYAPAARSRSRRRPRAARRWRWRRWRRTRSGGGVAARGGGGGGAVVTVAAATAWRSRRRRRCGGGRGGRRLEGLEMRSLDPRGRNRRTWWGGEQEHALPPRGRRVPRRCVETCHCPPGRVSSSHTPSIGWRHEVIGLPSALRSGGQCPPVVRVGLCWPAACDNCD